MIPYMNGYEFLEERNLSFRDLKKVDLKQLKRGTVRKGNFWEDGCVHLSKFIELYTLKIGAL